MNLDDLDDVLCYRVSQRWSGCFVISRFNPPCEAVHAAFGSKEDAADALANYIKEAVRRARSRKE